MSFNIKEPLTAFEIIKSIKENNMLIKRIKDRMWFSDEDQKNDNGWRGEYCGICRQKAILYELDDGICYCVKEFIRNLEDENIELINSFELEDHIEIETVTNCENRLKSIIKSVKDSI